MKNVDLSEYHRVFMGPDENGWYHGFILEFPGCFAQGVGIDETSVFLEKVAESWISIAKDLGQNIPEPYPFPGLSRAIEKLMGESK